jgi:hypothetical protein
MEEFYGYNYRRWNFRCMKKSYDHNPVTILWNFYESNEAMYSSEFHESWGKCNDYGVYLGLTKFSFSQEQVKGIIIKHIWKLKLPLKINIFIRFIHHKVILTKDTLQSVFGVVVKSVSFMTPRSLLTIYFHLSICSSSLESSIFYIRYSSTY